MEIDVSRETRDRLSTYVRLLREWQPALNLVSPATLESVWDRHVADCWQLVGIEPGCRHWIDMGSGAGLPGLIVAAADSRPRVELLESDRRKCAFLRTAAQAMGVDASVREGRIETVLPAPPVDGILTARALAPLTRLLGYAEKLLIAGATGLFLKGRTYAEELTAARESWRFDVDVIPSRTDPDGRILRISQFRGPA